VLDFRPELNAIWAQLQITAADTPDIAALFQQEPQRVSDLTLEAAGLRVDLSKNKVSQQQLKLLLEFAAQSPLSHHRSALFEGKPINSSENRAVLHPALRDFGEITALTSGYRDTVYEQRARMLTAAEQIRSGEWLGHTGKPITDIINIGIGGSDLGPKLVYEALREFRHNTLTVHFISNVDGAEIYSLLKTLNPETTLVAIASKTFTTQETLLNAKTALAWLRQGLDIEQVEASSHVVALTASAANAVSYGVAPERVLPFEEWVGGRYSLWSSIGFGIACAVGGEAFSELLQGAHALDKHFAEAPLDQNVPVLMALIGIWNINFLGYPTQAVIPYCERLGLLSAYLQQLDMESNGKSTLRDNTRANTATGPIVWGQTGTNGQHAFFQLMHQGTHTIPVEFIGALQDTLSDATHHRTLLVNMIAQASALMSGKPAPDGEAYRDYPGDKPSTMILIEQLTPASLGALIALYEHKVFVQGSLWGINSFDQWGVELGKKLTNELLPKEADLKAFDESTRALMGLVNTRL
jgi:glucose-6-phosphate isomerase